MVIPAVVDLPSSTGHVYRDVCAVRWALNIKDCGSVDRALHEHLQVCDMGFMIDTFLHKHGYLLTNTIDTLPAVCVLSGRAATVASHAGSTSEEGL